MRKPVILLVLLLGQTLWAAVSPTMVWEVNSVGSNTNGGGYKTGATGTDYSRQANAQYALTGVTSAEAGNTVLSASAAADMVGNVGCCVSGPNFTTNEFFEVNSVSVGVSITFSTSHASASISTGVGASGVINIGGAFKIGGTLDDEWFDSCRAGNTIYIQSSAGGVTYTLGEAVSAASDGTGPLPITIEAYITARGTKPTGTDRPTIACGAYAFGISSFNVWKYVIFTTTNTSGFQLKNYDVILECKVTNSGNSYAGFTAASSGYNILVSCEAVAKGASSIAINLGANCQIINCYIHDSGTGIYDNSSTGGSTVFGSIIDTCQRGINYVNTNFSLSLNNDIRNCITGISCNAGYRHSFINNIISDCVTGTSWTTAEPINYWGYNCFYNTTDNTNVTLDSTNLVASNPLLGSGLVSGTDGVTSASGLVFTAVSAPFSGVTTSDCLLIKVTGTGAVLGVYVISSVDSTSQLTLTTSAGASKSSIGYGLVKGSNFTLQANSPCFGTGLSPSSAIGVE